jgi:hypothetical protein
LVAEGGQGLRTKDCKTPAGLEAPTIAACRSPDFTAASLAQNAKSF